MGMRIFSSSSFEQRGYSNPDPSNYRIERKLELDRNTLVLEIVYPDCSNYEGRKILVFRNTPFNRLVKQGVIDPHFSNNKKFYSPFARFEPTISGWSEAVNLAKRLSENETI